MDKLSYDRINLLHPKIRQKVWDMYTYVNQKILGKGVRCRLAYTLRTPKEQDVLYAQGRTVLFDRNGKRLGKVTNAKGWQSIHNYGFAWDIVLLIDKNGDGVFETAVWDTKGDFDKDGKSDWMEIVAYFKSNGCVWGGDWSFVDPPHFEMTFGHSWRSLKALYDKGKVFTEDNNGVNMTWVDI